MFTLLQRLYADPELERIFDEVSTIRAWLRVEAALAQAQAACGILTSGEADAIAAAARDLDPDPASLWRDAKVVGYPILPLVRYLAAAVDGPGAGRVHYGATTQDIMDTGLSLQLVAAGELITATLRRFGDALAHLVEAHAGTVMAARTHAQQAVPTTFGAKMAVFLDEVTRHIVQVSGAARAAGVVSLYGAGGTSAALGGRAADIRTALAAQLDLNATPVPWHVARDRVTTLAFACAQAATTAVRLAREVIDLARTEVREVSEPTGHHRGASSTMPQKANPITSEAIVGLGVSANALLGAQLRASEAGHERAAGEWQVEWFAVPQILVLSGSALALAADLVTDLHVDPEAMRANAELDHGLLLAEAAMFVLAPVMGRESAHDAVYLAATRARQEGRGLREVLPGELTDPGLLAVERHLGDASKVCAAAVAAWYNRGEEPV
jgi:3-carboxy-cis,cis-muconate cycloisomerase